MFRRLPPDAFAYYLGLGVGRSYQAVAEHFGVTKTAVVNLAAREDWPEKLRQVEKRVGDAAAKKAEESIEQMNDRHLRSLKAIQGKALEALRSLALDNAMDAVRALDLAIRQERVVRGEPGDRATIEVGDVIRREYERWLAPVEDDAPEEERVASPADAAEPGPTNATSVPVQETGPSAPADAESKIVTEGGVEPAAPAAQEPSSDA